MSENYQYVIGVDPGTHTGLAVYDCQKKKIIVCQTMAIHRAMDAVKEFHLKMKVFVRFEDANLRTWFGNSGREKLMGAGSIKRDCRIWMDFLEDNKIPFQAVKPTAGTTKWNADYFKRATGWEGRTDEHNRDAGVLCFNH